MKVSWTFVLCVCTLMCVHVLKSGVYRHDGLIENILILIFCSMYWCITYGHTYVHNNDSTFYITIIIRYVRYAYDLKLFTYGTYVKTCTIRTN